MKAFSKWAHDYCGVRDFNGRNIHSAIGQFEIMEDTWNAALNCAIGICKDCVDEYVLDELKAELREV